MTRKVNNVRTDSSPIVDALAVTALLRNSVYCTSSSLSQLTDETKAFSFLAGVRYEQQKIGSLARGGVSFKLSHSYKKNFHSEVKFASVHLSCGLLI